MKHLRFLFFVVFGIALLLLCMLASITYGTKSVDIKTVWDVLFGTAGKTFDTAVVLSRFPRTIFGVLAGAALAVSGALMQAVTRNPIADPSILGVNTGASFFVVCGIAFGNLHTANAYIWLAFAGAAITALFVYGLASTGQGGVTPIKLALAGAAAATALQSLVNTIMLPNAHVMDQFRFWQVGSIGGAAWEDIRLMLPYLLLGFLLSFGLAPSLNTLALGDDAATSLGLHVVRVRTLAALAGVLLCAASTALAGPIGFVGLMVPHLMRLLLGPDMRRLLPMSALGGSCLLLAADVAGRMLGRPGELESGIVTALAGAPVFIFIIRKVKVRAL